MKKTISEQILFSIFTLKKYTFFCSAGSLNTPKMNDVLKQVVFGCLLSIRIPNHLRIFFYGCNLEQLTTIERVTWGLIHTPLGHFFIQSVVCILKTKFPIWNSLEAVVNTVVDLVHSLSISVKDKLHNWFKFKNIYREIFS